MAPTSTRPLALVACLSLCPMPMPHECVPLSGARCFIVDRPTFAEIDTACRCAQRASAGDLGDADHFQRLLLPVQRFAASAQRGGAGALVLAAERAVVPHADVLQRLLRLHLPAV